MTANPRRVKPWDAIYYSCTHIFALTIARAELLCRLFASSFVRLFKSSAVVLVLFMSLSGESRASSIDLCKKGASGCKSFGLSFKLVSPRPVYGKFTLNGKRLPGWKYQDRTDSFQGSKTFGKACVSSSLDDDQELIFKASLQSEDDGKQFEPFKVSVYSESIKKGWARTWTINPPRSWGLQDSGPTTFTVSVGDCS